MNTADYVIVYFQNSKNRELYETYKIVFFEQTKLDYIEAFSLNLS